jgi:hypothetical protein
MAVTAKLYGAFIDHLAQKRIDIDSDALKFALATSSYTPNQDTHDFFDDITNEVAGTGYTAGGQALTSVTWAYNSTTNLWTLDSADPAWGSSTITSRYGIIYDSTPASNATRPLIGYVDFGVDMSSSAGTFTVVVDSAGHGSITVT